MFFEERKYFPREKRNIFFGCCFLFHFFVFCFPRRLNRNDLFQFDHQSQFLFSPWCRAGRKKSQNSNPIYFLYGSAEMIVSSFFSSVSPNSKAVMVGFSCNSSETSAMRKILFISAVEDDNFLYSNAYVTCQHG